jgi:hypothetical protein
MINIGRTSIPHATKSAPFIDKNIIAPTERSPKKACEGMLLECFFMASTIIIAVKSAAVVIAG